MKKKTVNSPSAEWDAMEDKRELSRVLMVGTGKHGSGDGSFRDKADDLLPKYGNEHKDDYAFRRDHLAVVPPDLPDSVDNVVSAILNGPVGFEDADPKFWDPETQTGAWARISYDGLSGQSMLAATGTESIAEGIPSVFVGWDEQMKRPVWTTLKSAAQLELSYTGRRLTLARWRESVKVPPAEGEWEEKTVERVIVVKAGNPMASKQKPAERYASFQRYVKDEKSKDIEKPWIPQAEPLYDGDISAGILGPKTNMKRDVLNQEFAEIPLYHFYGGYRKPGVAWPVLRHQAELIRLFSLLWSDFWFAHHYAAAPREVLTGTTEESFAAANPGDTPAGGGNLLFIEQADGDYKVVGHDGASLGSFSSALEDLHTRIAHAGIETLRAPASGRELATLGLLERERKMTRLEVISEFWKSALADCVRRDELLRGKEPVTKVIWPDPNLSLLVAPMRRQAFLETGLTEGWMPVQDGLGEAKDLGALGEDFDVEGAAQRALENQASKGPMG